MKNKQLILNVNKNVDNMKIFFYYLKKMYLVCIIQF